MSDFTSGFWPIWITVIAVGGILGCGLLLWLTSTIKIDSTDADNTSVMYGMRIFAK
jgi:cytochrome c oxidase cbb3-type subunit 3